MKKLPIFLVYSRIAISPVMLLLAWFIGAEAGIAIIILALYGLISDIFDGIIARKLGVSTTFLRRLDSTADQIFWISILIATFMLAPHFLLQNWPQLALVVGLEIGAYLCCYFRFRKEIATHSILAKFWALTLCAVIVELNLTGNSGIIFQTCFYLGVISRLEIIAIVLTLKNWTNDVPSFYHAWQLRQGREIVRNKLFNG